MIISKKHTSYAVEGIFSELVDPKQTLKDIELLLSGLDDLSSKVVFSYENSEYVNGIKLFLKQLKQNIYCYNLTGVADLLLSEEEPATEVSNDRVNVSFEDDSQENLPEIKDINFIEFEAGNIEELNLDEIKFEESEIISNDLDAELTTDEIKAELSISEENDVMSIIEPEYFLSPEEITDLLNFKSQDEIKAVIRAKALELSKDLIIENDIRKIISEYLKDKVFARLGNVSADVVRQIEDYTESLIYKNFKNKKIRL